jgi:hypothetical protein
MKLNLTKILQLDPLQIKAAKTLRDKSIDDAIALPGGPSPKEKIFHTLWTGQNGYEVGVGKPGKETEREKPNLHDMWPFIRKGESFEGESASFKKIFHELEHMENKSRYSLELLACLLARSAFMLDHEIRDGRVVYDPPQIILDEITKDIQQVFKVPLDVFLQYLEMIALNEDTKYQRNLRTSGKRYGKSAGRPNNLLTCVHLISVLLRRTSIVDFAEGFSQMRGVSPIKLKQLPSSFSMLAVDKKEAEIISKEMEN